MKTLTCNHGIRQSSTALGTHWLATLAYLGNKSDPLQIHQNPNQATSDFKPAFAGTDAIYAFVSAGATGV
jgi:hypothetical protein